LLASLALPGHPGGIFTWGNLETLKDNIDDNTLYEKVHEFRLRHYSAHRMYLCIQARLPLDTLEVSLINRNVYCVIKILKIYNFIELRG